MAQTPGMWKRRYLVLASIAVATAAFAVSMVVTREPTYRGLTMGQWLKRSDYAQANEAILILGTNNLSLFAKRLAYNAQKDPVYWVLNRIPHPRGYVSCFDRFNSKIDRERDALMVFERLGTNAAPALPRLAAVVNQGGWPADTALMAASYLGPKGITFLGGQLTNTSLRRRLTAIELLGRELERRGPNSKLVRTILTNAMSNTFPDVQNEASSFLADYYDHQRPPYLPDKENN